MHIFFSAFKKLYFIFFLLVLLFPTVTKTKGDIDFHPKEFERQNKAELIEEEKAAKNDEVSNKLDALLDMKAPELEINIPQVKFGTVLDTLDEDGYIHIPYIGIYLSGVYKFSMVLLSIAAVIMIIVVGVKITVMGGEEKIAGFKRIGEIIIGLIILWGSYAILYAINPNLVKFDAIKVKYIDKKIIEAEPEDADFQGRLCSTRETCAPYCTKTTPLPPSITGMASPTELIKVKDWFEKNKYNLTGLKLRNDGMLKENVLPILQKAGILANKKGYILSVGSTYRPLSDQMDKYCAHFLPPTYVADNPKDPYSPSQLSWPGGSNHGAGIAVDVTLLKDGKAVAGFNKQTENGEPYTDLKNIMFESGWVRLKSEKWHYEYLGDTPIPASRCNNC